MDGGQGHDPETLHDFEAVMLQRSREHAARVEARRAQFEQEIQEHMLRKRAVFTFPRPQRVGTAPRYDKKKPLFQFYHYDDKLLRKADKYGKVMQLSFAHSYERHREAELEVRLAQKRVLDAIFVIVNSCHIANDRSYRESLPIEEQAILAESYAESIMFQSQVIAQGFRLDYITEENYYKLRGPALSLCAVFQAVRTGLRKLAEGGFRQHGHKHSANIVHSPESVHKRSFSDWQAALSPRLRRKTRTVPSKQLTPQEHNDHLSGSESEGCLEPAEALVDSNEPIEDPNSTSALSAQIENIHISSSNTDAFSAHERAQRLQNAPIQFQPVYDVLEAFDKAWVTFESALLGVTTLEGVPIQFQEHKHMITAMLSEALGEALRRGLATKEMVAEFDPALIFAIPRLAIVQYDIKALSASDSIWNDVLFEHDSPLLKTYVPGLTAIKQALINMTPQQRDTLEKRLVTDENTTELDEMQHKVFTMVCDVADHLHGGESAKDLADILNAVFRMNATEDENPMVRRTSVFSGMEVPLSDPFQSVQLAPCDSDASADTSDVEE